MGKKKPWNNVTTMRKKCDRLWSVAVKVDWKSKCAVCGSRKTESLNSHHLIPRKHFATRFDIHNGICLCYYCHTQCPKVSPHQNAEGWKQWLRERHPRVADWYEEENAKAWRTLTDKRAPFYRQVLRDLSQYVEPWDFDTIVGITLSDWLTENEESV